MTRRWPVLALVVGLLCAPALSAHHSWPVSRAELVTVTGPVTAFTRANPHPMISLEVDADDGTMEQRSVGGPALNRAGSNGWHDATGKPGDVITGMRAYGR